MIKLRSIVQFVAACAVVALGGSSFAETLELSNYVYFHVVSDAVIGNLIVRDDKPVIYLNGHTLKIYSDRPADWPKDGLPSFVVPGVDADGNPGKIIWKQGLVIFLR